MRQNPWRRPFAVAHPTGEPQQNGYVESFNDKMPDECLNVRWFENLWNARQKIAAWQREYNEERPHSSLSAELSNASGICRQLLASSGFALCQTKEISHRLRISYDPLCGSGGQVRNVAAEIEFTCQRESIVEASRGESPEESRKPKRVESCTSS